MDACLAKRCEITPVGIRHVHPPRGWERGLDHDHGRVYARHHPISEYQHSHHQNRVYLRQQRESHCRGDSKRYHHIHLGLSQPIDTDREQYNLLTFPLCGFDHISYYFPRSTRLCTKNRVIKVTPQSVRPIRPQNGLENRPARSH